MMNLSGKRILVTGGAGFVGSHLAERLIDDGNDVRIVDDLSTGQREWVPDQAEFMEADLTAPGAATRAIDADLDLVVHFAARKAVNHARPREQYRVNTTITQNILERMNDVGVSDIVFSSSSTVYGEAPVPTPEDYAPLEPISVYGASKLADEGLLAVYAHSHEFSVWNFRFANVVGPRLQDAVIPDFIEKLQQDPNTLTILGDGRQEKSYLYIEDCLDAMKYVVEHTTGPMATYNLGTRSTTPVARIADIVSNEMGLSPEYNYTGGDRGWTGDVKQMRLSTEKLSALGWTPQLESESAVQQAVRDALQSAGPHKPEQPFLD